MKKFLRARVFLAASGFIAGQVSGAAGVANNPAELVLAEAGKTPYVIVVPDNQNEDEAAATADLQRFLSEITGAKFTTASSRPEDGSPAIFPGVRAPGDDRPLAPRERRVRSVGKDIYLYGDPPFGNAFAVYDFLEKFLNCRWYSAWGDMRIPRDPSPKLKPLDLSVIPSFDTFEAGSRNLLMENNPRVADFFRRNRSFMMSRYTAGGKFCGWFYVGMPIHAMSSYIPPGGDPPATWIKGWAGPHPALAGKAYFKTNPEFFTADPSGRRVPRKLLCFSNPELRRTFIENIEKVIAYEKYDPAVPGVVSLDVNDKGGPFCSCPGCAKLIEKYGAIAGPYYDFLLEAAPYFKQKYPRLVFRFLAYGRTMTEEPPQRGIEQFPDNMIPFFAGLQGDFCKPFTHAFNAETRKNLENWSRVSRRMWLWLYPNTYPRPSNNYPVVAGGHRLAEDLRTVHRLGVRMVLAEFGGSITANQAFKELWLYLTAKMCENVNADEHQIIAEFMDNYYGAAAPLMKEYFYELEKLQLNEPQYLRWNPDPRVLSYINAKNVLRWQDAFDRMEELTRDDPRSLLHVRRVRSNLYAVQLLLWNDMVKLRPELDGRIREVYQRYCDNLKQDLDDMFSAAPDTAEMRKLRRNLYNHITTCGVDLYLAGSEAPKTALPENFLRKNAGRKIHRILPFSNKSRPAPDPEGAFGLSCRGRLLSKPMDFGIIRYEGVNQRKYYSFRNRPVYLDALKKAPAGYNLYYMGDEKLCRDTILQMAGIQQATVFFLGHLFDAEHPERRFDIYLSLKFRPPRQFSCDEVVLVERPDLQSGTGSGGGIKLEGEFN